ncbi:MAG: hypothetical protein HQL36_03155 [Alphaproteobacteria bacterium]|nr:hypothetical protein [Alphaproteobacteria bacterium]
MTTIVSSAVFGLAFGAAFGWGADRFAGTKAQTDAAPEDGMDPAARNILETNLDYLAAKERELLEHVRTLEQDLAARRADMEAALKADMAAEKKLALSEVRAWSEEEKRRLGERFDKEYREEAQTMRRELTERINAEFDQIRDFFADFARNEKSLAEKDIHDYLELKRVEMVKRIG